MAPSEINLDTGDSGALIELLRANCVVFLKSGGSVEGVILSARTFRRMVADIAEAEGNKRIFRQARAQGRDPSN